eukprot:Lankesteria_metandrocarpae@DN5806_c0_g1_i1.p1
MPKKTEHVIPCSFSKRQKYLYDEFLERKSTKETMNKGEFLSMMNALMQLRKVCNHPDLFEPRPVNTAFWSEAGRIRKTVPAFIYFTGTDSHVSSSHWDTEVTNSRVSPVGGDSNVDICENRRNDSSKSLSSLSVTSGMTNTSPSSSVTSRGFSQVSSFSLGTLDNCDSLRALKLVNREIHFTKASEGFDLNRELFARH